MNEQNQADLLNRARAYYHAGLNVLPALKAQKRPVGRWKKYAEARPEFDAVFTSDVQFDALAVVCGPTSGNLEIIDFDQNARAFGPFAKTKPVDAILTSCVIESTQSGGRHVAYRSLTVDKNLKLAHNDAGVLIETRGIGGICIIAPTDGYCVEWGDWTNVLTLSSEERQALFVAARNLNENSDALLNAQTTCATEVVARFARSDESVADYLRRTGEGRAALARAGWEYLRDDGEFEQWKRPGQSVPDKPGASWSKKDGYFHVFSTNAAPFSGGGTYSPLQVVALLEFGGDVSAASKYWSGRSKNFVGVSGSPVVIQTFEREDSEETLLEDDRPTLPAPIENVPFPQILLESDGLIGDLADLANRHAIRAQPEGAFLAALAATSYLAGRSLALNYNGLLVTPNLYALFLAPSGMGKEVPRRVCAAVASIYAPLEPVPESFASVQALQNLISRIKKVIWLHDEFGRDLAVMAGRHANSNISGIITESLKLYSNANNSAYLPKLIAQEAKGVKRPEPVDRPSLTIFATGNPREFYAGTTESVINNGYVSRFTIVNGRNFSPKRKLSFEEASASDALTIPASLASRIRNWRDMEQGAEIKPFLATFDKQAFDVVNAFDVESEKKMREEIVNGGGLAELRARLFEKVWKYALLFAASRFGPRPDLVVDAGSAERAVALVDYEARNFEANSERFANSETSALAGDMLMWIVSKNRIVTRSEWVRKFQRKDKRLRDEAIAHLVDAGYLEVYNDGGKICYKLR